LKKACLIICLLAILPICCLQLNKAPEIEITNGLIHALIYLPDTVSGYYRGSRFDWSGVISNLECDGHSYFGQWFKKYNPENHDAIMGPVEAFDPLNYDKVKTGGSFIKIGIGALIKPDELPYNFTSPYRISNHGKWEVKSRSDQVQFIHTFNDNEYGYEYIKTIQLIKNKPEMVLMHSLKNTGKLTIETTVYDHNFFMLDKQPTGPNFVITFQGNITNQPEGMSNGAKLQDGQIRYYKELGQKTIAFKDLTNGRNTLYEIKIENQKTGAGVRISGDQPISKLDFWSISSTVCPEPYIRLRVEPGKEIKWKITYTFSTSEVLK
jgi:hypothetical protein